VSASPYLFIGLAVIADGLAGLAGGLLSERWLMKRQAGLIGFAAGAILAATFLDVLPEALATSGSTAFPWAFGGLVAFAILEWQLGHHHHQGGQGSYRSLPVSLLLSDALHNAGDGAAVAAAFLISPRTGLTVTLAIVAHEVPQEVGDYAVLRAAGFPRGRALLSLAGVQMTAAIGAVGMILASGRFRAATAVALSIAAGSFLYIGATDLLPELHSGRRSAQRRERMTGFLGGIAVVAAALGLEKFA